MAHFRWRSFLHGRYQTHRNAFAATGGSLGPDRFLAAYVDRGGRPFALAAVDGGDTYWHPRPDRRDSAAMVSDEFLPLLAERGLRVDTGLGLCGLSMGGYGGLRLAGLLGADRVAAVAVMSPALWTDGSSVSTAGFADAAEHRRFRVFGHQRDPAGVAVRIDCGEQDPFRGATAA